MKPSIVTVALCLSLVLEDSASGQIKSRGFVPFQSTQEFVTPRSTPRLPQRQRKKLSVAALVKLLKSRRERDRVFALNHIDRFYGTDRRLPELLIPAIQMAEQSRRAVSSSDLRLAVLLCRSNTPAAIDQQVSMLSSRDSRIVMLAADALGRRKPRRALKSLFGLSKRNEFRDWYGFRHCTVDAVSQFREPESLDFLIDLLPRIEGQLKYVTVRHLTRVTGQNFGGEADRWRKWWGSAKPKFSFAIGSDTKSDWKKIATKMPWNGVLPKFYGVPLYAKRLVFVVDCSKSMLSSVDGETRLQRAKIEFANAINQLPEDVYFGLIAFERTAIAWRPTLIQATAANKQAAVSDARRLLAGAKTASFDALNLAISLDPNTELIVFLSDGRPTAGRIVVPHEIVDAVSSLNLFRRITIDTLGIDTRDLTREFMEDLAFRNFGKFVLIR